MNTTTDTDTDHIHQEVIYEERSPITGELEREGKFCALCEADLTGED